MLPLTLRDMRCSRYISDIRNAAILCWLYCGFLSAFSQMDELLGIMGNTQEACKPPGAPKNLQIQSVYCGFVLWSKLAPLKSSII